MPDHPTKDRDGIWRTDKARRAEATRKLAAVFKAHDALSALLDDEHADSNDDEHDAAVDLRQALDDWRAD